MSVGTGSKAGERSWAAIMSSLSPKVELCCLMCGRTVGEMTAGRPVHHAGCGARLRVERGVVRCCQCGGPVYQDSSATLCGG